MAFRTHYSNEVDGRLDGKEITLAGWIHELRDLGKLKFLLLRDMGGIIQVTAKAGVAGDEVLEALSGAPRESVVRVTGVVKTNPKAPGGVEISPTKFEVVAESESPLPMDVTGKVDAELDTRLENRFMDVRKPEVSAVFKIRSKVQEAFREYFTQKGFLEINPPLIIAAASEGGTELFAISYFEREAFLCQSPQLYKQMMMSSGFDKIFITTPIFRAETHNTPRHLNEIYSLDVEKAYVEDEEDVMAELEGVVQHIIKKVVEDCGEQLKSIGHELEVPKLPFARITYDEVIDALNAEGMKISWGEDLKPEDERKMHELVGKPYFITKWPTKIRAFYSRPLDNDPERCSAFDLMYEGVELSSGAQRIHDHDKLVSAIEKKGLDPKAFDFYLKAFKYGMPPHGGFGLGAERMTMTLTGVANIRECVLWPRDRTRLTP